MSIKSGKSFSIEKLEMNLISIGFENKFVNIPENKKRLEEKLYRDSLEWGLTHGILTRTRTILKCKFYAQYNFTKEGIKYLVEKYDKN